MAGVRFHRQRQGGQGRLHERRVVVVEAVFSIGRERIGDACSLRAVADVAVNEKLREIIRRAPRVELLENRKVALTRGARDAAAQGGGDLASAGARREPEPVHQCARPTTALPPRAFPCLITACLITAGWSARCGHTRWTSS